MGDPGTRKYAIGNPIAVYNSIPTGKTKSVFPSSGARPRSGRREMKKKIPTTIRIRLIIIKPVEGQPMITIIL
jgi:hypothetical protein